MPIAQILLLQNPTALFPGKCYRYKRLIIQKSDVRTCLVIYCSGPDIFIQRPIALFRIIVNYRKLIN